MGDTLLTLEELVEAWGLPPDLVVEELTPYVDPGARLTFYSAREVSEKFGSPEQARAEREPWRDPVRIVEARRIALRSGRGARRPCRMAERAWRLR